MNRSRLENDTTKIDSSENCQAKLISAGDESSHVAQSDTFPVGKN